MNDQERPQMIVCRERVDKPRRHANPLQKLYAEAMSGRACIRLPDAVHIAADKSEFQSRWDTAKYSIVVTQAFQRSQMVPGEMPLPQFGYVQQVLIQNFVVRLLSVFDNLVADLLTMSDIKPRKDTLFSRINALREYGLASDVSSAHAARDLRNEISHNTMNDPLDWDTVSGIADDLEGILVQTEIIVAAPVYSCDQITWLDNGETLPDSELRRKVLSVKMLKDGEPAIDYKWQYVWFLDPDWTFGEDGS